MNKESKYGLSALFFLVVIIIELYVFRAIFYDFYNLPLSLMITEGLSLTIALALLFTTLLCKGFHLMIIRFIAYFLLAAYTAFVALRFQSYVELLLNLGINSEPIAKAFIVAKIIILLLACIASSPHKPQPSPEEFTDFFVEAMELQKIEWARASEECSKAERKKLEAKISEKDPEAESLEEPLESS